MSEHPTHENERLVLALDQRWWRDLIRKHSSVKAEGGRLRIFIDRRSVSEAAQTALSKVVEA